MNLTFSHGLNDVDSLGVWGLLKRLSQMDLPDRLKNLGNVADKELARDPTLEMKIVEKDRLEIFLALSKMFKCNT